MVIALPLYSEETITVDEGDMATEEFSQTGLKISGLLRNDAIVSAPADNIRFDDILEARLITEYSSDQWKFYGDGRFYSYFGDIAETNGKYKTSLMRAFIRYYSPIGDITLGKTYVNFGIAGIFNPFEANKQVTLKDLSYDKEGILALEYEFSLGDRSGGKLYGGVNFEESSKSNEYRGGASLWTNFQSFDMGIVANRYDRDRNLGGLYLKGDAVVGLQASYGCHFNDDFNSAVHEASAGVDYSFFSGKLVLTALFYFNEGGSTTKGSYTYQADGYFGARYYTYGAVDYTHDEFFSSKLYSFVNCVDGSAIITGSCSFVITNGLTLTLLASAVTGSGNDEFSHTTHGWTSGLVRVEGKF